MDKTYDSTWWAHQLRDLVLGGYGVVAPGPKGTIIAALRVSGESFVMTGLTGKHYLGISSTDAARLNVHWRGFVEQNAAKAREVA